MIVMNILIILLTIFTSIYISTILIYKWLFCEKRVLSVIYYLGAIIIPAILITIIEIFFKK